MISEPTSLRPNTTELVSAINAHGRLAVGEVAGMAEIVRVMAEAGKVISV